MARQCYTTKLAENRRRRVAKATEEDEERLGAYLLAMGERIDPGQFREAGREMMRDLLAPFSGPLARGTKPPVEDEKEAPR